MIIYDYIWLYMIIYVYIYNHIYIYPTYRPYFQTDLISFDLRPWRTPGHRFHARESTKAAKMEPWWLYLVKTRGMGMGSIWKIVLYQSLSVTINPLLYHYYITISHYKPPVIYTNVGIAMSYTIPHKNHHFYGWYNHQNGWFMTLLCPH